MVLLLAAVSRHALRDVRLVKQVREIQTLRLPMVDRLVHLAEIVPLDGESYRLKEAKEEAARMARARAARRRKKGKIQR